MGTHKSVYGRPNLIAPLKSLIAYAIQIRANIAERLAFIVCEALF